MSAAMRRARGFTLLEVLIALVIAASALALGIGAVSASARRQAQVDDKTLAAWAIDNVVNDLIMRADALEPGRHRYVENLLGRTLVLEAEVARRDKPSALAIDVGVRDVGAPAVEIEHRYVETLIDVAGSGDVPPAR